ncbi:MAG: glycosyltransferase family 2 protein [Deltaproteobacteria bacterium]|nr:glycosyltransferase family 2 protein [Deltaproteobacteria bacterium]
MTISHIVALLSLVAAVAMLPVWIYLFVLTLLSWRKAAPPVDATRRLVCVVPAHNEEGGIGATVRSLLQASYPQELRKVLVIADNCTDATAQRARDAGAVVMERTNLVERGKGYALEAAFARVLTDSFAQGIIVVDADTVVADNLWRAVSSRLASGVMAMQVVNAVRNPDAGWRPRLQAITMAMINGVRSLGRERLGTSVGLRGTGMAFARETLSRVPHTNHSVVEDLEYGVRLGLAGIRVAFVPETWIASDSPVRADVALSQRRRWEGGRLTMMKTLLPQVIRDAVASRSKLLADLALDLMVPPISYPALVIVAGALLEAAHYGLSGSLSIAAPVWAFCALALTLYVLRGVAFSGTGLSGLAALLTAPGYIVWKLVVAQPWKSTSTVWVRTTREGPIVGAPIGAGRL